MCSSRELSGMHNFVRIYDDFSFELTFIELQAYEIIFYVPLEFVVTLAQFLCFSNYFASITQADSFHKLTSIYIMKI